jgi:hypothetical protein
METLRLRTEITTKWGLTLDQMATIMAGLHPLSEQARNWVLQELLTQEFYSETDMKEIFPVQDQAFADKSLLVWLLSEITQHQQLSVKHFQTLTGGMHQSNKYSFFCGYLQHPYICHQRVGVIWPWIARLTALVGKPVIAAEMMTFVKEVHTALPLAFSGKVSKCEPILSFLLHHALIVNTKKELMAWRSRPAYIAIKEDTEKSAAARKRDASPPRPEKLVEPQITA